jgi:hypothetical protein
VGEGIDAGDRVRQIRSKVLSQVEELAEDGREHRLCKKLHFLKKSVSSSMSNDWKELLTKCVLPART